MEKQIMKMKLPRGTLCKVVTNNNKYAEAGDIVEFLNNASIGYTFKFPDGTRLTFENDEDFQTLPLANSLKYVIDVALATNDKEWFDELMFQLEVESVTE